MIKVTKLTWSSFGLRTAIERASTQLVGMIKVLIDLRGVYFFETLVYQRFLLWPRIRILNKHNVWWVSIMDLKYGAFNIWTGKIPSKYSWFFRGMYRNAYHIKPLLWMNTINSTLISFLNDPWYFEIPIAYKPTYLNIDIDIDNMQISDLISDNKWNINQLQNNFWPFLE